MCQVKTSFLQQGGSRKEMALAAANNGQPTRGAESTTRNSHEYRLCKCKGRSAVCAVGETRTNVAGQRYSHPV